jgi:DNA-binding transcriptional LysR family regulator
VIESRTDIRALRALIEVADAGSFRGAARALGYTQSAVSHQIASLERHLGASVIERRGGRGGVRLTPIGELAYQHARRVLAATHALEADLAAALAGERGTLRIGITHGTGFLVAEALARLRRHSPRIEVALIDPGTSEALTDQLAGGQLDVALYLNVEADERIGVQPLFEDDWVIIASEDDPLACASAVGLEVLDGADMIAWHQGWRSQARLEDLWRQLRITPRIVYRTDDSLLIQTLVAAGLGYACMSALSLPYLREPRVRRISISDRLPPRTLSLCYAEQRELLPAAAVFMDAVREASVLTRTKPLAHQ